MNKLLVALSLGCLTVCARAEMENNAEHRYGNALQPNEITRFASDADRADSSIPVAAYLAAPGTQPITKNNYTLLLGSWPRPFTLEDIYSHSNRDFYALAETNPARHLTVFMRVEQLSAAQLQRFVLSLEGLASELTSEYLLGTGVLLNNSLQPGDGLGVAIAYLPGPSSVSFAYGLTSETAWGLSYFLPLVKSLRAQTSVYYLIGSRDDLPLYDAVAAELRLNFKF